jgi:hypothetical protein
MIGAVSDLLSRDMLGRIILEDIDPEIQSLIDQLEVAL